MPSKALDKIGPAPHIPEKKTTKEQHATVLTTSQIIKNKQELEETKAETEKGKWKEAPKHHS
jgi:hypothetical protein